MAVLFGEGKAEKQEGGLAEDKLTALQNTTYYYNSSEVMYTRFFWV